MNKYNFWYNAIVENARTRTITGYKETHHILPRSLGGTDDKNNLVDLTAREHFICHWLLVKIHTGEARHKMVYALNGMKRNGKDNQRYETPITSRVYAKLRNEFSEVHSKTMKGRTPSNKGRPMSEEQKAKIKATKALNPYKYSQEQIAKRVAKQIGQKRSEETKLKMSLAAKGKPKGPMGDNIKQLISASTKGKTKNPDSVAKRQETLKRLAAEGAHHSMVKVTCPHCDKEVTKLVYGRLHGDRCKSLAQDK